MGRIVRRGLLHGIAAFLGAALLAACQNPLGGLDAGIASAPPAAPASTAETIGSGSVRVAMLLPRTAAGNGAATGLAFRNAAALAMGDFPEAGIELAIYDTAGSPAGAQAAIGQAIGGGARLVLGPVFSQSVSAIAPAARQASVPVIAFSSDASVAGQGVYLLSFLPSDDVRRIVSYAAEQGRRSYAALLPANAYGTVAEASFREAASRAGGRIVAIERYEASPDSIRQKAAAIAALAPQVDAIFMPDGSPSASMIGAALGEAGIMLQKVRLLGSGQWDDPAILADPSLAGGWYPGPEKGGFQSFAQKYRAAYGAEPPRNATLAYDATVLAIGLVRQFGDNPFSSSVLTNPSGFAGIDGVFRFQANGLTERQLAVYEVSPSGAKVIAPAPRSFGGGS